MRPHRTAYRVIYGDTDNMGQVYYANYFRWFEIGRTEFFRHLGLPYREVEAQGILLPVSETFCKFRQPVRYDDLILIETALDGSDRAGIKFTYNLLDENGATLLAEGYTRHACVTPDGRVVRPPALLRTFIQKCRASGS
jgi:acyl-CoA thioester hydrolase